MPPFNVDQVYLRVQGAATSATIATNSDKSKEESNLVAIVAEVAASPGNLLIKNDFEISNIERATGELTLSSLAVRMEYITDAARCTHALAVLGDSSLISVDIETARNDEDPRSGLDPHKASIRLVQFYDGNDVVYVFDCFKEDMWSALSGSKIWSLPMVAHNALFELKHLKNAGIVIPNIGCTMLQSNALTGELPKLSRLVKKFLNQKLNKEYQTSDWAVEDLISEQLEYAALDAVVTYRIAHIQADKLAQANLIPVYLTMKNAQTSIAEMELNGFLFNLDDHELLIGLWKEEKAVAQEELTSVFVGINLNSGKQVAGWLQENLDKDELKKWPKTPKGQLKTDTTSFSHHPELEVTRPLLVYKELAKKLSTYSEKYRKHINNVTGRIHGNYRLGGNVTGRIPCSSPNLQQIPRDPDFRSLFIAPPGKLLLVADYSQIQLRIAALLSKDQNMLEAFNNGIDLHKQTAAAILAIPATNITKEQRQMGKAVSFGLLFGQGARGLARYAKTAYGIDMSELEASEARAIFFKSYPELAKWQRLTGIRAKQRMRVETPGGRVRDFNREKMGYKFTEALNTPIQGAEAEILMNTLGLLPSRIKSQDIQLVNIIHDELVFEIEEDRTEIAKEIIERAMVDGFLRSFPEAKNMTSDLVESSIGNNWYEAK